MILGSRYTVTNLFSGEIGEVLVYDVALGASDRAAVEGYLSAKWSGGIGTNYCVSTLNSTGAGAVIAATGTSSVAANDVVLAAEPVPDQPGIFFYGPTQVQQPFGNGFRCVGGTVGRLAVELGVANRITHALDNTQPPNASTVIAAGSTWNFQAWYRDPAAGGASFNLSDGLELTFTP